MVQTPRPTLPWLLISLLLMVAPQATWAQDKAFMLVVSPRTGELKVRNSCSMADRQHSEWICLESAIHEASASTAGQQSGATVSSVMSRGGKEQRFGTRPSFSGALFQPSPTEGLKVAKVPDTASSKLQQAMNQREPLEVTIEFTRTDQSGREDTYQRLRVTDATITSIASRYACGKSVEEISFSYSRIKQEDLEGGRVVSSTCKDLTTTKPCS